MATGKKSSGKSNSKKTAAKKSPAEATAAPKTVAEKIASTAPVTAPHSAPTVRTAAPSTAELYDEIRRRAYEFYRARGGQHGSHEADWHRAETEVRSKYK
jgi:Protein of unknown function (DUF2934)